MNPISILGIILTLFEETQRLATRIQELEQSQATVEPEPVQS